MLEKVSLHFLFVQNQKSQGIVSWGRLYCSSAELQYINIDPMNITNIIWIKNVHRGGLEPVWGGFMEVDYWSERRVLDFLLRKRRLHQFIHDVPRSCRGHRRLFTSRLTTVVRASHKHATRGCVSARTGSRIKDFTSTFLWNRKHQPLRAKGVSDVWHLAVRKRECEALVIVNSGKCWSHS